MARVTVEDCLDNVDNRFELVMLATKRSRQLATGGKEPKVAWENDKPTVVALREIAEAMAAPVTPSSGAPQCPWMSTNASIMLTTLAPIVT